MIDQIDSDLQAWVKSVIADIEVTMDSPDRLNGKRGISLYLLAIARPSSAWINRQHKEQAALRYLVTTWSENEKEAHYFLGKLLQAAMEQREFECDLEEPPATLWSAFGVAPRPAFTLNVPFSIERAEPEPRLVQGPLVVRGAPVRSLDGIVLGPGNIPIVGAGVELPALQLRRYTDTKGRFRFSTVPGGTQDIQLVVRAKGQLKNVTVEHSHAENTPLEIRFAALSTK